MTDERRNEMAAGARQMLAHATPYTSLDDEVRANTPGRMAKALDELLEGYNTDLSKLATVFDAPSDDIVVVRDMEYVSVCEHHVLPFRGTVTVAYIPDGKVIGLSKIPRIVRAISRRLQVQERLTKEIADALVDAIKPKGVMVVIKGVHSCAELRGIEARAEMVTSHCQGVFRDDVGARQEVMSLLTA